MKKGATEFKYVGCPTLTRGEFGNEVRWVQRVSWQYDPTTLITGFVPDPDGEDYRVWDEDLGWLAFWPVEEHEVGPPIWRVQDLHDLREQTAFCSGERLRKFFEAQMGEPSPSGLAILDDVEVAQFLVDCGNEMRRHSKEEWEEIEEEILDFLKE